MNNQEAPNQSFMCQINVAQQEMATRGGWLKIIDTKLQIKHGPE